VGRLIRPIAAILLAFALGSVPLVADWCAATCEAAHATAASAEPSCHHTASPSPRVGEMPTPCSHDHHPVVVDAATIAAAAVRVALTHTVPASLASIGASEHVSLCLEADRLPAQSPPLSLELAAVLRI
jgi:hypothetical protein